MEVNPDKLPKSALSLYVKLYCKRKGETKTKYCNNLIEATKSWVSLSEQEKQQFNQKLEECRGKFKHRLADYLKNVQPYLKKKPQKRISKPSRDTVMTLHETIQNENKMDSNYEIFIDENVKKTETEMSENCWLQTFTATEIPEQANIHSPGDKNVPEEEPTTDPLPQPIPPNVQSAEQLFDIVKAMGDENEKTWKTLSSLEKRRYRNSVLALKKQYISQYKAYLESLPSEQLFIYYNNNKIIEP